MPKEQWDMMVKDALQKVEDVKQKYIAFLKEKNVSRVIRHISAALSHRCCSSSLIIYCPVYVSIVYWTSFFRTYSHACVINCYLSRTHIPTTPCLVVTTKVLVTASHHRSHPSLLTRTATAPDSIWCTLPRRRKSTSSSSAVAVWAPFDAPYWAV